MEATAVGPGAILQATAPAAPAARLAVGKPVTLYKAYKVSIAMTTAASVFCNP
jgi:hypothetical protein